MTQVTLDGATTTVYEQVARNIEIAGLPISGYSEMTGGGTDREGQTHVFNGKGEIVGTTNGRAVPQAVTIKMFPASWEGIVKPALIEQALLLGITGDDNYQKVDFVLVDQFASQTIGARAYTKRQSFKVKAEKPDTPSDGNPFQIELELFPTSLPKITYS